MPESTLDNSALIILGMHRSGTSATARLCNLLGADLGPDIMPAAPDNPRGFWEPLRIVEVHDELLRQLGTSWDDPAPLPDGWQRSEHAFAAAGRLRQLLLESFGNSRLWAVKDPRLCRLLPLWLPLLDELGVKTRCLLVSRPPAHSIASLVQRNGFHPSKSALLWLRYVTSAVGATRGRPRCIVSYEGLLADWRATMCAVEQRLDLVWPTPPDQAEEQVRAYLDPGVAHHRDAADTLPSQTPLARHISAVYDAMVGLPTHMDTESTASRLEQACNAARAALHQADGFYADTVHEAERLVREHETARNRVVHGLEEKEAQLRQREQQLSEAERENRHRLAHMEELESRLQEVEGYLSEVKASRSWRITAPLRAATDAMRDIRRAPSRILAGVLRSLVRLYRWLPLSPPAKYRLRVWGFRVLGPILKGSALHEYLSRTTPAVRAGKIRRPAVLRAPVTRFDPVALPVTGDPVVSVVIPVYNKIEYTWACLQSIADNAPDTPFEVIVVDDCSSDDTHERLAGVRGLRYFRNQQNSGFIRSCNHGAEHARGSYLLFLNNDCEVQRGWLDSLVATFGDHPEAGLVGSRLLFPDGTLQEAGGIVWQDGTAWNYGRGDNPGRPEYSYLREVDYISGASIMVPIELFRRLGGFDIRYAPAYYEDTDLAFRIRAEGLRTLYQPFSQVVHHEGVTSGTDVRKGAKAYQVRNHKIFYERWREVLQKHRPNGDSPHLEQDRGARGRILFLDAVTPMPDHDSGSNDTVQFLRALRDLGYKTTFVPEDNLAFFGHYTEALQAAGTECLYHPYTVSVADHLRRFGDHYDVVVLSRVRSAARHMAAVQEHCPHARIVFNTVDLHHLREERQAQLQSDEKLLAASRRTRKVELEMVRKADLTLVVSEYEARVLREAVPDARIRWLPLIREVPGAGPAFDERRDLFFVGGYQHPPNADAVYHFLSEIWPLVKARLPELTFYILGADMPERLASWKADGVQPVGYVEDLTPWLNTCRLSVAPLRFGAGAKGKIISSISHGLPVVATRCAAEGMGLENGKHAMVADEPAEFADAVVRIYRDANLWKRVSESGLELARARYSYASGRRRIAELIDELRQVPVRSREVPRQPPGVTPQVDANVVD